MTWVNAVVQGILLGGLYALFATGLSLMFGVMKIINLAHGDLAILGAFLVSAVADGTGIAPLVTLIFMLPAAAIGGYLLQQGILTRALRAGELAPLLATFGLLIVIQNMLLEIFSSNSRSLRAGSLETASWRINDQVSLSALGVVIFAAAVVVLGGLQLFLTRSNLGRSMRATASDPDTAGLVGIDARSIYAKATAIAMATALLAGSFFAMRSTIEPTSGSMQLIFAFEAVVIGGLGSLWGTLVGGVVLGVAQTVGAQIEPSYSILAGHLVFLVVLAFKRGGIFAVAARA
jgi:branched-chain amino acid transport system permease protein